MSQQQAVNCPNTENLMRYLKSSKWHNVSSNFSGFVRKEFYNNLDKLEEDEEMYRNIKLMIEFSEMGRYSEARDMVDAASKEFQEMLNKLTELKLMKHSPRRAAADKPVQNAGSYQRRETYTPDKREIQTPQKRNVNTPNRQQQNRPNTNPDHHNQTHTSRNPGYETPKRFHEVSDRSPRHAQYHQDQTSYDPHVDNYDSLRLKSPEKPPNMYMQDNQRKLDTPRNPSPVDHGSRPSSYHHGRHSPAASGVLTSAGQMASSKALWGRDHGDRASEKVGFSTYKQDFPTYAIDHHERKDKEAYRQNFGSLAERGDYRGSDDSRYGDDRRSSHHSRHTDTDFEVRPSEIAAKFKDLQAKEWLDAYDEICKDFGSEATVRHLLWIVTEASEIANEVADHQLKHLERQTFGVLTHPEYNTEAWLIAIEVAEKQLSDLEKSARVLMETPNPIFTDDDTHRVRSDTLPASRKHLMIFRKQNAHLSVAYVKKACKDEISNKLVARYGFQRQYLDRGSRLTTYIYKCAELVWLMCVQEPPVVLEYVTKEAEGTAFNHEHYHVYTKGGTTYDYGVWPMLRIGHKGHILAKGTAQGI